MSAFTVGSGPLRLLRRQRHRGITAVDAGTPTVHIYIEVDDLPAYLSKIERAGGQTIMPPTEVLNMATIALFADPDGLLIGLVQAAAET